MCDFGNQTVEDFADEEIPLTVRDDNTREKILAEKNRKNYNYKDTDYDDVDPMNLYYGSSIIDFYDSRHGDEFSGLRKPHRRESGVVG